MTTRTCAAKAGLLSPVIGACCLACVVPLAVAQSSDAGGEAGLEVLTRGPLHEGFGAPLVFNAAPAAVVTVQPPDPIAEVPSEYRPRGTNVGWMPGYWDWDSNYQAYVWVSGFWRLWPPRRQFIPGYWETVKEGGWRRVTGFWARADVSEIQYLPDPPKSLEIGPSSPAPSADHLWVPGCWNFAAQKYQWRAGFWTKALLGWIWVPAHHLWTPAGVVYHEGNWDFPVEQRSLLSAPVLIASDVRQHPSFHFRPRVVLDSQVLLAHLFCRLSTPDYCFGDYYSADWAADGVYPWFVFHRNYGHDPLYAYYSWLHGRTDPAWQTQLANDYRYRSEHEQARPSGTFAAQHARSESQPSAELERLSLGRSLFDLAAANDSELPLMATGPERGGDFTRDGAPMPLTNPALRAAAESRLALQRALAGALPVILTWRLPTVPVDPPRIAMPAGSSPESVPPRMPPVTAPPILPGGRSVAPRRWRFGPWPPSSSSPSTSAPQPPGQIPGSSSPPGSSARQQPPAVPPGRIVFPPLAPPGQGRQVPLPPPGGINVSPRPNTRPPTGKSVQGGSTNKLRPKSPLMSKQLPMQLRTK